MAKGQPVTREEIAVVLKEEMPAILADFRKILNKDIAKALLDFNENVQEPMVRDVEQNLRNEIGVWGRKLDQVTDHQAGVLDSYGQRLGRVEAAI